ncbi:type II secretion system protein [Rheinheimera baltica]|uniref:Type II secretion system protein n=1 Tax=Rheinheimera baltica TaxID=67576 RepID=A0ABT9HUY0_9GAMM|nr:type II secretion system protein [Rheinheimera baltica]MDP5134929.1 type II secretion system protein [Rheinheimera baltica]MDP5149820.1 type II secretion system protein [Rheinheimera baltica]
MIKQAGLTLIEVLIASMILFMALGLIGTIFQQSFNTQRQAQKYISVAKDYSNLQSRIRYELSAGEATGQILIGTTVYTWKATLIEKAPERTNQSPEMSENDVVFGMLHLFLINVSVEANSSLNFEFKQAIWLSNTD